MRKVLLRWIYGILSVCSNVSYKRKTASRNTTRISPDGDFKGTVCLTCREGCGLGALAVLRLGFPAPLPHRAGCGCPATRMLGCSRRFSCSTWPVLQRERVKLELVFV